MAASWRRCQKCRKVLPVEDFDADHVHPYTRELMAASPVPVG